MERGGPGSARGVDPFELKNRLVALAKHRDERLWLNAGRGNPNWVALAPRAAFIALSEFALAEAGRVPLAADFGSLPSHRGIAARLRSFVAARPVAPGPRLLARGLDHACRQHGFEPDALVGEWVDGVLGDHYPLPVRMLPHAEALVREHLVAELFGGDREAGAFDLFATEGASAGIVYLFQSLVQSRLLAPGDRIALGVPIFAPYLELPALAEYGFDVVPVVQDEATLWRYPSGEIERLRDPRIKLFLAVNPSNPTAVAMEAVTVAHIAAIAHERPELILVTDDVYAPFVAGFRSLAAAAPRSTVVLYSFSKFWGATGLRLGVIGLHRANALDARLAGASGGAAATAALRAAARARYGALGAAPQAMKLIDRMVADSRAVALNHTAGLSAPQQVQMTLFALDALLDESQSRKHALRALVGSRYERLFAGAGLAPPADARLSHYYLTLDLPALARARHGEAFARWFAASVTSVDFVLRLAAERGIVVLDAGGFAAPPLSVRISLANLGAEACEAVGRAIVELIAEDHRRWLAAAAPAPDPGRR